MSGGCKALVLREIGRSHVYGRYLYDAVVGGQAIAKIAATPDDAKRMAAALQPPDREPVAWRVRRLDAPDYWIIFLHRPVDALQDPEREVQPLYTAQP